MASSTWSTRSRSGRTRDRLRCARDRTSDLASAPIHANCVTTAHPVRTEAVAHEITPGRCPDDTEALPCPLSDGIRAKRFPYVNIAFIAANFLVWIYYELPQVRSGRRVAVIGHSRGGHYARAMRGPPPRARLGRDLAAGDVPLQHPDPGRGGGGAARTRTHRARLPGGVPELPVSVRVHGRVLAPFPGDRVRMTSMYSKGDGSCAGRHSWSRSPTASR